MKNNGIILFYGFLLICSVHWAGSIIAALLSNIIGYLISYDKLIWFDLFIFIVEILFSMYMLNKISQDLIVNNKILLKMSIFAAVLLLFSEFSTFYDFTPHYCGNALINGELDLILEQRGKNEIIVNISKPIILAISIMLYSYIKIRFESKENL